MSYDRSCAAKNREEVDAISEFLEDIYLTKEEEERLKKADELIEKGKLQRG